MNNTIEIIDFNPKYSQTFHDLNTEWLEKYFYVEPHDKEVLENAKSFIIDNNGYIFFAKYNNKIAGTVALINNEEGYELSKMAVSPKFQGLKIGQKLMSKCIEFAKEKKWNELILYSNTKLTPAINMYRKNGFVEIPVQENCDYERCNIKMILKL
ncbi:GNAT family N-acetyltransferase [Urechidicola croceus]|uniref:GNAT family N-acetyltransferase n=1 Tax=Urechidicola croceus TaxID=1850246 RepID=A0A1D8PBT0_9FLAO|nr:GNAT family N-acetyltransferase [Urechidicola croceus]AOW21975.1 GNAT family N-acetyltransferase [Urechidicola croceus]